MANKSHQDRVVPLPKGHSWLINGGDPNHLRLSWDDPPSIWDRQNIGKTPGIPLSMAFSSTGTVPAHMSRSICPLDFSVKIKDFHRAVSK